jgi:putative phosphoesterase
VKCLHPNLLSTLRAANLDCILHAGDISTKPVIAALGEVAPVEIARGNRDWSFREKNGWVNHLELGGVPVALMHGHGSWKNYLIDKVIYMLHGQEYRFERYQPVLLRAGKNARVIVFGHTHHAENFWIGNQLIFNPGSASFGFRQRVNPSWGILKIYPGGQVEGEILELKGYRPVKGEWIETSS